MKKTVYKEKRTKVEANWKYKPLEVLENDYWGELREEESYLITTCYQLRKKPLSELTIEDLRILIGQDLGLKYLIPLALDVLAENILAEGDFYEGDLLKAVLTCDPAYWIIETEDKARMTTIFENYTEFLKQEALNNKTVRDILKAFEQF